jgi:hypothetical protein
MAIEHEHWITIEEYHQIEQQNSEVKYEYSDRPVLPIGIVARN